MPILAQKANPTITPFTKVRLERIRKGNKHSPEMPRLSPANALQASWDAPRKASNALPSQKLLALEMLMLS